MKFTCEVIINQPRKKVLEWWLDAKQQHKWQEGFERKEMIEGKEWEKGAKAKLYYQQYGQESNLLETIIQSKLPDSIEATYEHAFMTNTTLHQFEAINNTQTKWTSVVEYTNFTGKVFELMAAFIPQKYEEQLQKMMDKFKAFVEGRQGL